MEYTYSVIPEDTFKTLAEGAGVVLDNFNPSPGKSPNFTMADIIGATSGGNNFSAVANYSDRGAGIDNCPKNMAELKELETWDVKLSGTFATITAKTATRLLGAADEVSGKVTPRQNLKIEDFKDIWLVTDYGDTVGGKIAIHIMNALSTGGFAIQTKDKDKGTFSFEFTGHYKMNAQKTPPFEVYISAGASAA